LAGLPVAQAQDRVHGLAQPIAEVEVMLVAVALILVTAMVVTLVVVEVGAREEQVTDILIIKVVAEPL
jgi:hypothetical protein